MATAQHRLGAPDHPVSGGLGRRELLAVIGAFAIFALGFGVVMGALHFAQGLTGEEVVWSRRVSTPPPPKPETRPLDFEIAGVRFGITAAALAKQQPGTRFNTGRSGKTVGAFRRDGGDFTVGFLPARFGGGAYEVRYEQVFRTHDEDAVLAQLGQRFGWPATTDCGRKGVAAVAECQFRWYPEDAVEVEAHTRPAPGLGQKSGGTELTLVARDTVSTDRLASAAAAGEQKLSPLGRLLEKLPF